MYYIDANDTLDEEYISSHWRKFTKLFDVTVDGNGEITSLKAEGFSVSQWSGFRHRILDTISSLHTFALSPNKRQAISLLFMAKRICRRMGLDLTTDVMRQVINLAIIKNHGPSAETRHKNLKFLMIGDGYGVLSALVKVVFPKATIVMVDIGKTLLFQAYYCQKAHPEYNHVLVNSVKNIDDADFVYCPTEYLESLSASKFDIAVNTSSMQEMKSETVEGYFGFLRSHLQPHNLFYCLNRESKTLIGGEVSDFLMYPWDPEDILILDRECPWYRYYMARGAPGLGKYVFGLRIPFLNLFDTPHLLRLANLKTK